MTPAGATFDKTPADDGRAHAAGSETTSVWGVMLAILAGPAIILLWIGLTALAYILFEPGKTVMVFGPQRTTFAAVVEADAKVLSSGDGFLVVRGDNPGYVRKLYSGGAWLVMPTSEMMCGHPGALRKIATGR